MAGSLPAYISGWFESSGVSVLLIIQAIFLYEFLPFFLGVWGGFGGLLRKDPLDRFLLIWWAITLGLVLLYQGRQVFDLVWVVIPLAGLAGRQLARMVSVPKQDRLPVLGQALLAALILGFISITIVSMVNNTQLANAQEYWFRLAGALIMLFASAGLIGWGWSKDVAVRGFTWGLLAVLFLYAISTAWDSAHLSFRDNQELWTAGRQLPEERLLLDTIENLSEWGPVVSGGPDLVVVGVQSPALRWALRNHPKIDYTNQLSVEASPALLITMDSPELALASTYRGQDFILSEDTDWKSLKVKDWVRWLVFRSLPGEVTQRDRVVLWARTDLFPGGELQVAPDPGNIEAPAGRE